MSEPRAWAVRVLARIALMVVYLQTVFGAVVRITGSGFGCGDEWPKCRPAGSEHAYWIPPLERPDLIIEVTHRYLALAVGLTVVALYVATLMPAESVEPAERRRRQRWAFGAVLLVVAAATLGRQTVKLGLAPLVVTAHLALALLLLGTLAYVVMLTGGFGAASAEIEPRPGERAHGRTRRAAIAAAALAFVVPVLGGLTATFPSSAVACSGFPHCREVVVGGAPLAIHLTHRILAFLLLFHVIGLAIAARRRHEPAPIRKAAWKCAGLVIVQVLVAAAMIEMAFPPPLRSLHQAIGVLVWLETFSFAALFFARTPAHPSTSA